MRPGQTPTFYDLIHLSGARCCCRHCGGPVRRRWRPDNRADLDRHLAVAGSHRRGVDAYGRGYVAGDYRGDLDQFGAGAPPAGCCGLGYCAGHDPGDRAGQCARRGDRKLFIGAAIAVGLRWFCVGDCRADGVGPERLAASGLAGQGRLVWRRLSGRLGRRPVRYRRRLTDGAFFVLV